MLRKRVKTKTAIRRAGCGILTAVVLLAGMWAIPARAANEIVGYIAGHPIYENNLLEGTEIVENEAPESAEEIQSQAESYEFDKIYDPRKTGGVPVHIEDQGVSDTCWAFSTVAAMECNLIKNGYEDYRSVNLSENFLAYFFYNRQTDPLNGTSGDMNLVGTVDLDWSQNGGSIQATANFLTTWAGITEDTGVAGEIYTPEELPDEDSYATKYHVKNMYLYDYSVETVKRAIMEHGSVVSGIYMDWDYWESGKDSNAYYCQIDEGNHAVAIVGWDDTYSKDNFKADCQPEQDGAWIVRNSWGSGEILGDDMKDGYLYVSYEDASLGEIVAFEMIKTTDDYTHNYQYDGSGNPVIYVDVDSNVQVANTFVAKGSEDGYNEELKAVSIELFSTWTEYQVEIYAGLSENGNPTDGTLVAKQSGILKDAGSQRIELDTPVELMNGERYAVVFSFVGENPAVVALDYSMDGGWIKFENQTDARQSYFIENSEWIDLTDVEGMESASLRIKAYTDDTEQKTVFTLDRTSLTMKQGDTETLSAALSTANMVRDIVWTSSDESVAVVENGTVTAVAPGKVTITAAIGDKTVSCEVTVYEKSKESGNPAASDESQTKQAAEDAKNPSGKVPQTGDSGDFGAACLPAGIVMLLCAFLLAERSVRLKKK